jgi:hypothetical protein
LVALVAEVSSGAEIGLTDSTNGVLAGPWCTCGL